MRLKTQNRTLVAVPLAAQAGVVMGPTQQCPAGPQVAEDSARGALRNGGRNYMK